MLLCLRKACLNYSFFKGKKGFKYCCLFVCLFDVIIHVCGAIGKSESRLPATMELNTYIRQIQMDNGKGGGALERGTTFEGKEEVTLKEG